MAAALALVPASLLAHEFTAGPIAIGHPWSRATPPGARVAAGYLTLTNTGSEPDRLVAVASAISGKSEIHEMKVDAAGVMTMRPVAGGLEIPPGATVKLEPGAFHLMFTELRAPAVEGETFKGELTFAKAGTVTVEYAVEGLGAVNPTQGAAAHDGPGHDGSDHGG